MKRPNPKTRPAGESFRLAMVAKAAAAEARGAQKRLRDAAAEEAAEARVRREAKRVRRAEGMARAAQFQVLDPSKLGKMSKKQLRSVRKTRMNRDGVVELVPAYS